MERFARLLWKGEWNMQRFAVVLVQGLPRTWSVRFSQGTGAGKIRPTR